MNADELVDLASVRALVRSGAARSIRLGARLSLAEVARAVGVTPVAVFRWERAERVPRGEPALRYGELLQSLAIAGRRPPEMRTPGLAGREGVRGDER